MKYNNGQNPLSVKLALQELLKGFVLDNSKNTKLYNICNICI